MFNDTSSVLTFLKTRKSGSAKAMTSPGPSANELAEILNIGVRVPDHGKLAPWRFVLFEGDARARIGDAFAARWKELNPGHGEDMLAAQRGLFQRAPTVLVVVSRAAPHPKIPEWEQQQSAAAVCANILMAASAMGFAAQWRTDWIAYDDETVRVMGLSAPERIAGVIYLGTASELLEERPRPDAISLLTRWDARP
jgi:nitroreductase